MRVVDLFKTRPKQEVSHPAKVDEHPPKIDEPTPVAPLDIPASENAAAPAETKPEEGSAVEALPVAAPVVSAAA
jgi:hypothetical protein